MLQAMRRRMEDDKGFTLIELMVVVLIIAILLAVAIPTFLRVRRNAQDRAAQNSVSAALKAEKAEYTSKGTSNAYTGDASVLKAIEASIDYDAASNDTCSFGATSGPKCVQVTLVSATEVVMVARSESGSFFAIRDIATGAGAGTFYGQSEGDGASAAAAVTDAASPKTEWA
jgi:type IV pilus assembly protein PilA